MPVLYLIEQGSTLRKDGDVFVVSKDEAILKEIHAPQKIGNNKRRN